VGSYVSVAVKLTAGAVTVLLGCWLFTSVLEWVGARFGLTAGAVGSVMAAVATALPETSVPLVAVAAGFNPGVAEGAILGAPLMLSTLAMGVGGITVGVTSALGTREGYVKAPHVVTDLKYFLASYGAVLAATVSGSRIVRIAVSVVLIVVYVKYVFEIVRKGGSVEEGGVKIEIADPVKAALVATALLSAGAVLMVGGADVFASGLESLALLLGLSALTVSSLISPVATELPEKVNSVIWYARGRDELAMGNVTGAMVFQATFPASVGLVLTPWNVTGWKLTYILVPLAASGALYARMRLGDGRVEWWYLCCMAFLYPVPFLRS